MIRARLQPRENAGSRSSNCSSRLSLMLIVMSSVFQTLNPVHGAFRAEPETADLQQRLRVAADALSGDLRGAGGGLGQGLTAGPLTDFLAPILPMRQGRRNADAGRHVQNRRDHAAHGRRRRCANHDRSTARCHVFDGAREPRSWLPAGRSELRLQSRHVGRCVRRHRRRTTRSPSRASMRRASIFSTTCAIPRKPTRRTLRGSQRPRAARIT